MNDAAHSLEITGNELSLHATGGEIILLTGNCGSGKTRWLQQLAGLEPLPPQLRLTIDRQTVARQPVRMLYDRWPPIWLGQTIDEELRFGLPRQLDPQQIAVALAEWGLPGLAATTQTPALNRLQSIRVSLTAISLAGPALVLLDNPTDALPAADATQLIADISSWTSHSKTIVVVACNRWHDWLPLATQHWQVLSPDLLPQVVRGHA